MRYKEFIAEHRGGPLTKKNHKLLALWAADCAEHVLSVFTDLSGDPRPQEAVNKARAWAENKTSVGDARKAAFASHDAAREIKNKSIAACEAARSAGHAAATAHMADHCIQAAKYALKTVKHIGLSVNDEIQWQSDKLPEEIEYLVLAALDTKES